MTIAKGKPMVADDILNLAFFPKGTILIYTSDAWNNSPTVTFKDIWKICDGNNGTPDLTNKFKQQHGDGCRQRTWTYYSRIHSAGRHTYAHS
ncbi:MAG: hypothetical protein LBJ25_06005 [Candidatus Margulisbacteria bacterium]|jgi:hypothetical protein|nr:hypothetical protein [Candidatus Margulisiibacteriota bacterium]